MALELLSGFVLGLHMTSAHIPMKEGYENFNPGIYARFASGVTVGTYANTLGKQTFYAGWTVERGPLALTIGFACGYQRTKTMGTCAHSGFQLFQATCQYDGRGTKAYLTPMLAPSVQLPEVRSVIPRLSYIPGLAGSSNVFHLSVEKSL